MANSRSYRKPPAGVDKSVITLDRLWILDHIVDCDGESTFQSLAFYLDLAPGSLGHHLSKLEGAGVIRTEKLFVDRKPITKALMTVDGWRVYNDFKAQMREWIEQDDKRRAVPRAEGA